MPIATMKGSFAFPRITQAAATVITQVIPAAMRGARTRLTQLSYLCGSTIHTITVLKALARTTITEAAAAAATSIKIASAAFRGDTIANLDYLVIRHTDGTFSAYLASALSTLTVTIPALAAAVAVGDLVWIMGATGEVEHMSFKPLASTLTRFEDGVSGIAVSGYRSVSSGTVYSRSGNDDPLLVHSNNATAAGVFESISGYYGAT